MMENHTLYGFHMSGNECQIDPMGFIVFESLPLVDPNEAPLLTKAPLTKIAQVTVPPLAQMKLDLLFQKIDGFKPVSKN